MDKFFELYDPKREDGSIAANKIIDWVGDELWIDERRARRKIKKAFDKRGYEFSALEWGGGLLTHDEANDEDMDEELNRIRELSGIDEKKWIQKAVDPEHEGDCTPMSKASCTPHKKALARRFKKGGDLHN